MANFCFYLLHFDSVQFMCMRTTGNEEHSVRKSLVFLQLLCMENLHATSDSSRSEFLTCIT